MDYSSFGNKLGRFSGITQLMDDLNEGLANPNAIMLGGGNPAKIPAMQTHFNSLNQRLLDSGALTNAMMNYDGPQGKDCFISSLAKLLRDTYGWPISEKNISLSNGSQSAFFNLFNLLAGEFDSGQHKKIMLPLAPEYIGYADSGLSADMFSSVKPTIELLPNRQFKYHVDFDALTISDDIGAICVSRPTNPTGNVLTDAEISKLDQLARENNIPLIVDNAYGVPFPDIIFEPVTPFWNDNTILCMSLSKLGLPGVRCGIVIANEEITTALTNINGVLSLAPGSIGPLLGHALIEEQQLLSLSSNVIKPYYHQRATKVSQWLLDAMDDPRFQIHKPEGAIFLWLWFDELPISSLELYRRLKQRGVLIVPGEYFFIGIDDNEWHHQRQCIRMNYVQDEDDIKRGIAIIAEEVQRAYSEA